MKNKELIEILCFFPPETEININQIKETIETSTIPSALEAYQTTSNIHMADELRNISNIIKQGVKEGYFSICTDKLEDNTIKVLTQLGYKISNIYNKNEKYWVISWNINLSEEK